MPLSYRALDKMRLAKDKTSLQVNPSLTLASIPKEAFDYRLGNRSALDSRTARMTLSTSCGSWGKWCG